MNRVNVLDLAPHVKMHHLPPKDTRSPQMIIHAETIP
uniref:Uncharacterized protein n=1 Tax=Arundo donax TaxID=35708 RepID=A0A0A9EFH4_ARUDO